MIRHILLALTLLLAALTSHSQQINPITQATLNAYSELLKENPKDYQTFYQRAAQYYRLNMYNKALDDIGAALTYTPDKDKDMKSREYTLLANILTEQKEYARALEATEAALAFNPGDYALLYQKGNLSLHVGNVASAKSAFQAMQRIKSRSQEALVGLARCDIMEKKYEDAKEKMSLAEDFNSISAITYSRLGDLYAEMDENYEAALKYLTAFALADNTDNRPLLSLYALSAKDYDSLMRAMNYAVEKSGSSLSMLYLKGSLAAHTGHYTDAYNAFTSALTSTDGRQAPIYDQMAEVCIALNKLDDAIQYANSALSEEQQPQYYTTRAKAYNAAGQYASALIDAQKGLSKTSTEGDGALLCGIAAIGLGNKEDALRYLNTSVMLGSPAGLYPLMLRAWVQKNMCGNAEGAQADWQRAAAYGAETVADKALKGLAQSMAGKQIDSATTLRGAETQASTGDDYYWLAVAYTQSGNAMQGQKMLEKAIENGFENRYLLETDATANLNIVPLRTK